jgi:hypothetical protein
LDPNHTDADLSDQGWPPLPKFTETDQLELLKIRYQAVVDEVTRLRKEVAEADQREISEGWQRGRETQANEYLLDQAIHQARIEVAKASLERSYKAAEFVRNAAAAIVTLYTGILGVSFATSKDAKVGPLPARGLLAAVFLALAIVLSTAFVALLQRPRSLSPPKPSSVLREYQDRRLNAFVEWTTKLSLQRAYLLHASVISLGWGTAFLPAPFLAAFGGAAGWWAVLAAFVSTFTLPIITIIPVRNPSSIAEQSEPS